MFNNKKMARLHRMCENAIEAMPSTEDVQNKMIQKKVDKAIEAIQDVECLLLDLDKSLLNRLFKGLL